MEHEVNLPERRSCYVQKHTTCADNHIFMYLALLSTVYFLLRSILKKTGITYYIQNFLLLRDFFKYSYRITP
jgi:hypothetical protein